MKIAGRISAVAIALLIAVFFSACSFLDFFSTDTLLRAPKLTGANTEIQTAFESAVGKDVSLLTPLAGLYKSSYIFIDLNRDGQDEAVVFYVKKDNENVVHMHLLSYENEQWHSVYDIIGNGSDVYEIEFYNLDLNADLEIVVTWTVSDSKREKTLSLYKLVAENNTITPLATVQMIDYICFDIDADRQNEFFYIYADTISEQYDVYARLLKINASDNTMLPISELKLSSAISSIVSLSYDRYNSTSTIYIDCQTGDEAYFTEIVSFDGEKSALLLPLSDKNADYSALTKRSSALLSEDIDDDGRIEIPLEQLSEQSYITNTSDGVDVQMRFIDWLQFSDNALVSVRKVFINEFDDYSVNVSEFQEYAYIVYDYKAHVIQARLKNPPDKDGIIFSITCSVSEDRNYNQPRISIDVTELGRATGVTRSRVSSVVLFD